MMLNGIKILFTSGIGNDLEEYISIRLKQEEEQRKAIKAILSMRSDEFIFGDIYYDHLGNYISAYHLLFVFDEKQSLKKER